MLFETDRCTTSGAQITIGSTTISTIPGDKSISHRVVICGALAENETNFSRFLRSEDCLNTLKIMRQLGVPIQLEGDRLSVSGVGKHGLVAPKDSLDVGNSGTAIRLLAGILAAQSFDSCLTGDESIQTRPMLRVVQPLRKMGAKITGQSSGNSDELYPPLTIHGQGTLSGLSYQMPIASAQVKSCLLLAGLYADADTVVEEPAQCRDHTERLLKFYGVTIHKEGSKIRLSPPSKLVNPGPDEVWPIPADVSSALFLIVLGLLVPGTDMTLTGIGLNPTRTAALDVLKRMGGKIEIMPFQNKSLEPMADIRVQASNLQNTIIRADEVPNLIDEIPILSVAACFSEGSFILNGAAELRVKESDRLSGIVQLVATMGGSIQEKPDGFTIQGTGSIRPFTFDSKHDHRMAMSAIIAALIGCVDTTVSGCASIATSFPNFFDILEKLGFSFKRT